MNCSKNEDQKYCITYTALQLFTLRLYSCFPYSPVGTPRKLVTNMTVNSQHTANNSQSRNNKKELSLNPQWITAFPTVETPSESGKANFLSNKFFKK